MPTANSKARILVVDDEAAQMKALCDTLPGEDYEPVGFTDAQSALAELRRAKCDLLLADLRILRGERALKGPLVNATLVTRLQRLDLYVTLDPGCSTRVHCRLRGGHVRHRHAAAAAAPPTPAPAAVTTA